MTKYYSKTYTSESNVYLSFDVHMNWSIIPYIHILCIYNIENVHIYIYYIHTSTMTLVCNHICRYIYITCPLWYNYTFRIIEYQIVMYCDTHMYYKCTYVVQASARWEDTWMFFAAHEMRKKYNSRYIWIIKNIRDNIEA
jgi:hypothetical protein